MNKRSARLFGIGILVPTLFLTLMGLVGCGGHGQPHTPHHGVVAKFNGAFGTGYLELKLHDDRGDLELWLASDEQISQPFDLPLEAEIAIEFLDVDGRKVTLRVRNRDQNEGEDGRGNVGDGKTNYFIYPTVDGEDASWLRGKDFSSKVVVRFSAAGESLTSGEFTLKPHTH
jgi:hypothetical protein